MPYCRSCGSPYENDDLFCPECGNKLDEAGASSPTKEEKGEDSQADLGKEPEVPTPKKGKNAKKAAKAEKKTIAPASQPAEEKQAVKQETTEKPARTITVGGVFIWVASFFFTLFGFFLITEGLGLGFVMVILALIYFPPLRHKLGFDLSTGMKWVLFFVLVILLFVGSFQVESSQYNAAPGTYDGDCYPSWRCEPWGECSDGVRIRYCADKNSCGREDIMPLTKQRCDAGTA